MSVAISKEQALALVYVPEADLFDNATKLRTINFGTSIELCAIINTRSGQCSMDCAFCSQSKHHKTVAPSFALLGKAEIEERLTILKNYPIRRVGFVTSGGALQAEDIESLADIFENLPKYWQNRLCASLGKLDAKALAHLKSVGLTRYHHNLETSRAYYPRMCSTQTWDARLDTIKRAQQISLEVCAGGLFGLGETWEDRIDFALSLRKNNIKHVPINFLHPHAGTPLAKQKPLEATEALRIIAIFRHILPNATLRVCGGRPLVLGERQGDIFAAGANALMTGNYLTTSGLGIEDDCNMLEKLGLTPCLD